MKEKEECIEHESERKRIGERILELRKDEGLSIRQFAELAGINYANICKIEKGRYNVGIDILSKISQVFNRKIDFNSIIMNNNNVYQAIAILAKHLCENNRKMTFSQLAIKLSILFDYEFCDGRGMANRVRGAWSHFKGDADTQKNIAEAFITEQGDFAYE